MKKAFRSLLGSSLPYLFLFGTGLSARAQNPPGVTDKTIVIGSCFAPEGPSHSLGAENVTRDNASSTLVHKEGGLLHPPHDRQGLRRWAFRGHPHGAEKS